MDGWKISNDTWRRKSVALRNGCSFNDRELKFFGMHIKVLRVTVQEGLGGRVVESNNARSSLEYVLATNVFE